MKWRKEFNFYDLTSDVLFETGEDKCICKFMNFTLEIFSYCDATSVVMHQPNDIHPIFDLHMQSLIDLSSKEDIESLFGLCVETCSQEKGVYAYEAYRP